MESGSNILRKQTEFVWRHGALQFANIYTKHRHTLWGGLLWGDEMEYFLVRRDDQTQTMSPATIGSSVVERIKNNSSKNGSLPMIVMPEYATFMMETTPPEPFSGLLDELHLVEKNLKARRRIIEAALPRNVKTLTIPGFPRFGCPKRHGNGTILDSDTIDQDYTANEKYYQSLETNVVLRAGDAYSINIPVFQDKNTLSIPSIPGGLRDNLRLSSPVDGFAVNSLQITCQTRDLHEARYLYDQLLVICPIMTSLTAGCPVQRGLLTEVDSRTACSTQALDDRTSAERQPLIGADGVSRQQGPRLGVPHWFMSESGQNFNDGNYAFNKECYNTLINLGVDPGMAMFVAVMFTREPLYLFERSLDTPDVDSTHQYELVNHSNWGLVRLKLPTAEGDMGWRLEVRPMGIQLTDFENAAFAVFMLLLTRALREFSPDFLIPMSKLQENMRTAMKRDAACEGKFFFRSGYNTDAGSSETFAYMTADEIVNGNGEFQGLVPLTRQYVDKHLPDGESKTKVQQYLKVVSNTASGERPTTARRIRDFVRQHAEYQQDSVVTERIQYDLIQSLLRSQTV